MDLRHPFFVYVLAALQFGGEYVDNHHSIILGQKKDSSCSKMGLQGLRHLQADAAEFPFTLLRGWQEAQAKELY